MKRILAFILIVIYFVTTAGATLQLHYCMDELSGWSLAWTDSHSDKCGKCGMEKDHSSDNGCCRDENKLLKIQDDQKASQLAFETLKLSVASPAFVNPDLAFTSNGIVELLPRSKAPPRSCPEDICIRYCIFRI